MLRCSLPAVPATTSVPISYPALCLRHSAATIPRLRQPVVLHLASRTTMVRISRRPGCIRRFARVQAASADNGNGATPEGVIICGAGIIGAATAYYLAQKGIKATVVDRAGVACSSSGKAGGFLALDWQDGSPTGPLSRKSFELHKQLAKTLGADCGYRPVSTLSLSASSSNGKKSRRSSGSPDWLDGNVSGVREMGSQDTTAQVHPELLTKALLHAAEKAAGTTVRIATVDGIELGDDNRVQGVSVDGEVMPASTVVIAMGAWSGQAQQWLKNNTPAFSGQKAHSIIVKTTDPVTAHCLFLNHRTKSGRHADPEVYPRPDGSVYICGEGESVPLPDDPLTIQSNSTAKANLMEAGEAVSSLIGSGTVEKSQACFLPQSQDGVPVIGKVPNVEGAYIASGHTCWGILNGPCTGYAMAELIADGKSSINLRAFDPARFSRQTALF